MTRHICHINDLYGKQNLFNVKVVKHATQIQNLQKRFMDAIKKDLATVFTTLMKEKFIHTVDDKGMCEWSTTIEALFLDHTSVFLMILQKILDEKNNKLIESMLNALATIAISPDKLYDWNDAIRLALDVDRDAMNDYAEVLKEEAKISKDETAGNKAETLSDLSGKLSQLVKKTEKLNVAVESSDTDKLQALCYKLQIREVMDAADSILSKHRGYRRVSTNIVLGIFILTPQMINYGLTRNFWFANKTASQQIVDAAAKDIGLDVPLHFATPLR